MMNQFIYPNSLRLSVVALLLLAFFFLLYLPYRRDIRNAYAHLESLQRQIIETECGPIEVAIRGDGEPVLVIHGISGGFDQGLGIAQSSLGDEYQIIVPSRFGYLGTPLPANATPASQADAYACLLDTLHLNKVTVMANSAGGTSALQMALRHPNRVQSLVFISTAAPTVGEYITLPPKPVIQFVFNSDFLMWAITTHFQKMMQPAMGIPESYPLSEEQKVQISNMIRSVLPIKPRTAGFVFDMFTSNVDMDQHPDDYLMESISVPTLIIHAVDDSLASYENAKALAERIPNAELLSIPTGGHLLLGSEETVTAEIGQFIQSIK
jgi:pimeloyl-ACP methyl ester carboxylesterase